MLKSEELADPNSCFNRARDDEMIFVLLERDIAAPEAIRYWVTKRLRSGKNQSDDPQIIEAVAIAQKMEDNCVRKKSNA